MSSSQQPLGLYIHVPFCAGKCPYCDFYSLSPAPGQQEAYTARMDAALAQWGDRLGHPLVGSVYFGGGTPSLLGAQRLAQVLESAARHFKIEAGAEITCEANPGGTNRHFFAALARAGFNRLSLGLQSANPEELSLLGRRHSPQDAAQAVEEAEAAGLDNISLDLMLGLPGGSRSKLENSLRFAAGLEAEHISAYLLKVEPGTPFAARNYSLDGDEAAEQYLFAVETLARYGYRQYEISNFARPGKESRHNLVYWQCGQYLGLGPGAHSFLAGQRFYWPRDLAGFLAGNLPVNAGPGGGKEEFAMLALRLNQGLTLQACQARFPDGQALFWQVKENAKRCPNHLVNADNNQVSLTPEGFLVSNALLARLLEGVE